jgi:hypothetical protein
MMPARADIVELMACLPRLQADARALGRQVDGPAPEFMDIDIRALE